MLDGRCIVVTGASGNLGSAVCRRLLEGGASVVALVHRETTRVSLARALAGAVPGSSDRLDVVTAELAREASVEAAYDGAVAKFGGLWASVQCAGGWKGGATVAETPLHVFEEMIAVNLRNTFLASRAALRRFTTGGRIVNVAAFNPAMGFGLAGSGAYAASKAAIVAFTLAIAEEGAKDGIRANCVAPGTLRTETNARGMPAANQDGWVPLEDVSEAIAQLCSPASGALTGAVLTLPSR